MTNTVFMHQEDGGINICNLLPNSRDRAI